MGIWDNYEERIGTLGGTVRGTSLKREKRYITNKLPDNLSYQYVTINSVGQDVAIINTDNLNTKFIYSMPGESLIHGGLVYWQDNYWLITELDVATEVYTRAKMLQCNYLLKWVDIENGAPHVIEQWSIVEDGTKYLTGEMEDRNFVTTRGDSRLAVTLARNKYTVKLGRENRFLIDDPESPVMLAYILSKPFKLTNVFNGDGVYKFVLQEVNSTDDDNMDLGVADYYKYFPIDESLDVDEDEDTSDGDAAEERNGWT